MDNFEGAVAVVTGGGSGIGRSICLALAEEGANVVVADIDDESAGKVAEELTGKGVRSIALAVDVSQTASVSALAIRAGRCARCRIIHSGPPGGRWSRGK